MNLTPDDPKLTAYALGELDATERAAVEAALARSPECRRAVAEIQALSGELTTALAPIGGEGRGEGASRDAHSVIAAFPSRGELHALAAMKDGAPPDSARLSPSPQPSPPVGAREKSSADAPGDGNILFLPPRYWRTLGMAAAAAVVLGFFLAKAWRTEPAPQHVQHRITEQVPAPAIASQRPTNQVSQAAVPAPQPATPISPGVFTYSDALVTVTHAGVVNGTVSVDYATVTGTAVAGVDYIAQNGTLTFAERERLKASAVPQVPSDSSTPRYDYRFRSFARSLDTATLGQAPSGATPRSALTEAERTHWYFAGQANNLAWGVQRHTGAAYPRYVENPFTLVASEPLSTFSTDVDTASYANVRRFLNQNQLPPADAVRLEELLNYFAYDYAPPTGEHPFAAHVEVAGCPWTPEHRLVRVGLKGRELKADKRPPSNFVFLIDVSGSMSPVTRLPLIKQSLRQLVKRMTENDRVAMVVYASSSGTVLESTSAVNKEVILAAIDRLEAGGSTNGGEGIQRAYDLAVANFIKGGVNRVLLCTDGDFNVGITDRGQLLKLIEEKAKSGVFLTTLGVGDDNYKDATLQQLADKGNGNYHYLDSVEEGHKVLVEQMNATLVTIAKDVKVQIDFNPAQVKAYRLIGYEKRILATQDFNNDAKDAGEIGAGHTVTALYEVCPVGVPLRTVGSSLEVLESANNLRATNSTAGAESKYGPFSKLGNWMNREEYVSSKMQTLERIAELAKTLRPTHPKMQELYQQLEASEKLLRDLGPASKELLTLKLRYKAPDGDKSKLMELPVTDSRAPFARASADFKFASAVVEFGMLLKDSPFKGTATFDSTLELAGEGKGNDTHGYRAEFINLVAKAKALKK